MPDNIVKIYCKGLLASVFIEVNNENSSIFVDKLIEVAMRKGLMSVRTCSGTLKIGPPLSIPEDALIEGVNILKESLIECLDMLE
jgi:4-aminobutyrate aminotransferase-like enzyme